MAMALDDQPQLLDMVLDRLGTRYDPRLVAQQASPCVFGGPRFTYWMMSDGKAKHGERAWTLVKRRG
jgi:hypothetical protein